MKQVLAVKKSVDAIKALLEQLPVGAFRIVSEKWGHEIIQDNYDDYPILWEIHVDPANQNACPIGVVISSDKDQELKYGLTFDKRMVLEKRLGLRVCEREPRRIGFGAEPAYLTLDRVLDILRAVFNGRVRVQYIPLGSFLVDMAGEVETEHGIQRYGGGCMISYFQGESFQYEPWRNAR